ncbi:MAG: hypothetical protein ACTSRM_00055 [Alphaproteobacteria bacterium]|jgi:hypothetical protein|uniref:hypothetical protein n=1 Tax=Methyloceanibacter sp. TaxID=1965321 RepID=UPI00356353A7
MSKKLILAAAAAGLVAATALPMQSTSAQAGSLVGMPCKEAAKLQFPDDRKMARAWAKECVMAWMDTKRG